MAEKPIIFSTPMVQAILEGRKTQTRRVIKPQPTLNFAGRWVWPLPKSKIHKGCCTKVYTASREWWEYLLPEQFPYQPGDRLWVRETWGKDDNGEYVYRTNYGTTEDDSFPPSMFKWRPSIHMPKEAARIWLEVEDVRVERVQDITENDADWEGVGKCPYEHRVYGAYDAYDYGHDSMCWVEGDCLNPNKACSKSLREHFCEYWNSLNVKRGFGWDTNPWVWVIEFKMVEICQ